MSGPKGGSYSVANNLAIERAALEAARSRAVLLRAEMQRLQAEAASFSGQHPAHTVMVADPGHPSPTADRSTTDRFIATVSAALAEGRAALSSAQVGARVDLVSASLGTGGGGRSTTVAERLAAATPMAAPAKASGPGERAPMKEAEDPAAFVARVIARLDGDAPAHERDAVEAAAAQVLRSGAEATSAHRVQLRLTVDTANTAAARVRADRATAERLLADLLGLTGSAADEAVRLLSAVTSGSAPLAADMRGARRCGHCRRT